MDTQHAHAARRFMVALLLAAGLGGCAVYAPPYSTYDPYYSSYSYPTYVGPPIGLNFDFGYYKHKHHGGYRGHHGYYGGHHRHGWRHHGGWGRRGRY